MKKGYLEWIAFLCKIIAVQFENIASVDISKNVLIQF